MNTLFTIDWDFFVPEKIIEWDLGHKESEIYLKMLWTFRAHLMSEMKLTGLEKDFWQHLPKKILSKRHDIFVSDSHLFAYHLTADVDHVILVDRHHDCFDWPTFKQLYKGASYQVDCGNWAAVWLSKEKHRRLTWVYPDDLGDISEDINFKVESGRKERFTAMSYTEFRKWAPMFVRPKTMDVTVHVCRSGCWTPPWLDMQFCDFVIASGLKMQVMQDGVWDPMMYRWNLDDYKTAERVHEETQKLCKQGRESTNELQLYTNQD